MERIRAEAQAMAAVSHPHLAVIYSNERWMDRPVLMVEYLEGGTLGRRVRSGPLPLSEALRMGIDLAGAVAALHEAGILHRHIKPSNIGFARGSVPKLLDFGIARLLIDSASVADAARRNNRPKTGVRCCKPQMLGGVAKALAETKSDKKITRAVLVDALDVVRDKCGTEEREARKILRARVVSGSRTSRGIVSVP